MRNISPPPGFDSRTVQPVASPIPTAQSRPYKVVRITNICGREGMRQVKNLVLHVTTDFTCIRRLVDMSSAGNRKIVCRMKLTLHDVSEATSFSIFRLSGQKEEYNVVGLWETAHPLSRSICDDPIECSSFIQSISSLQCNLVLPLSSPGIFYCPSVRTMDLVLTQPLTAMSTRNIYWGLRRPVRRAENPTTLMCRLF